jgi:hypothetical protein
MRCVTPNFAPRLALVTFVYCFGGITFTVVVSVAPTGVTNVNVPAPVVAPGIRVTSTVVSFIFCTLAAGRSTAALLPGASHRADDPSR